MPARLLAACLLWLCALAATAAPRIGVATMQPGEIFFERFGHDAIVVLDPTSGRATSYNFGFFDPGEADFIGRFARGEMMYYLVALPLQQDLESYRQEGRGVSVQWLDLDPRQAQALADALAVRARPENARYRYDYYTDNCATQVRDALDQTLGGALKRQFAGRSRGSTYRSESVRLASPATWMWIGFDLGIGPYGDVPLSRWEEAFVPMRLAELLADARLPDGRPLVVATETLLPHRIAPEPAERPRRWWPWLLAGLALAAGLSLLARRRRRAALALGVGIWLVCGLGGAMLLFLWGWSEHRGAWANRNLLLLDPLCLLLCVGAIAPLRGRPPATWWRWLLLAVAAGAALAWMLHWLPFGFQDNRAWVALLLPVHLAFAHAFARPRPPP